MARWTASAKWAAGPALDGQRDMPLALRLSEGLGVAGFSNEANSFFDTEGIRTEVSCPRERLDVLGYGYALVVTVEVE